MKKVFALLLAALLILSTGCAAPAAAPQETPIPQTASPAPVSTPAPTPQVTPLPTEEPVVQEATTDLAPLLSMTRKDVTAQYGAGKPVPYGDISDYNETGYALYGFPCEYSELSSVLIFYDAVPQDDDAAPYYCKEDPNDFVLGIMLPPNSDAVNVNGAKAALNAEILKKLFDSFGAKIEHVNGMYEYYEVVASENDVQYVWRSDSPDMADATLYFSQAQE